jgi:hypothetical protein
MLSRQYTDLDLAYLHSVSLDHLIDLYTCPPFEIVTASPWGNYLCSRRQSP